MNIKPDDINTERIDTTSQEKQQQLLPGLTESDDEIAKMADIEIIKRSLFINELLTNGNSLFAVLNEQWHIVALNDSFLHLLGMEHVENILGLRLGEYLNCVNNSISVGGCGTSTYCEACGGLTTVSESISSNTTQVGACAVQVQRGEAIVDLNFQLYCIPVSVEHKKFILFFINKISMQQSLNSSNKQENDVAET